MAFCRSDSIRLADLPVQVQGAPPSREGSLCSLAEVEKGRLLRVLERTGWNVSRAAKLLGLGRPAVYHKIEKHGLNALRAWHEDHTPRSQRNMRLDDGERPI